jgi:hypothetical protein
MVDWILHGWDVCFTTCMTTVVIGTWEIVIVHCTGSVGVGKVLLLERKEEETLSSATMRLK